MDTPTAPGEQHLRMARKSGQLLRAPWHDRVHVREPAPESVCIYSENPKQSRLVHVALGLWVLTQAKSCPNNNGRRLLFLPPDCGAAGDQNCFYLHVYSSKR